MHMGQCASSLTFERKPIPAKAGVGLRQPHILNFVEGQANVSWVEVHAENYMCDGGPRMAGLLAVRDHYPVSLHGVGLSLGSAEGIEDDHLSRLADLASKIEPGMISEHLSWSVSEGHYLNDLLPLPLNEESLKVVSENINKAQDALKRRVLIENPSVYISLEHSDIPEYEFLNHLSKSTGCGILLDVNNIYVSSKNTDSSTDEYLENINLDFVEEIHIAGHSVENFEGQDVLIDTHGDHVCDDVWSLLEKTLRLGGSKPVLMEWDTNLPTFEEVMVDVNKADALICTVEGYSNVA